MYTTNPDGTAGEPVMAYMPYANGQQMPGKSRIYSLLLHFFLNIPFISSHQTFLVTGQGFWPGGGPGEPGPNMGYGGVGGGDRRGPVYGGGGGPQGYGGGMGGRGGYMQGSYTYSQLPLVFT